MYDFICGDSAFNLECLRELGEQRRGDVLPIPVKFPYKMIEKKYIPGKTLEFIFVGRMVQNKRIEDIVDVFVSYHNNFNKNSRLTLVGNTEVDRNYTELINQRIQNSNCSDSISLTGKVSDNELQQIFKRADMYLCMSEHEGFCIPLIEAMYNGLIVFAYDSATISDTLGGSGILLKTKEPDEVSEIINTTLQDENHVNDIIGKEIVRAQSFSIDNVEKELADLIAKWSSAEYKKRNDLLTSRPGLNLRLVIMMFMPGLMPFLRKVKHAIVNK
jgi:glycosyltransferase involved in cell wall biosynthesis